MPDLPISGLPVVPAPASTDLLPIEQSGTTYQETVAQVLTASVTASAGILQARILTRVLHGA